MQGVQDILRDLDHAHPGLARSAKHLSGDVREISQEALGVVASKPAPEGQETSTAERSIAD